MDGIGGSAPYPALTHDLRANLARWKAFARVNSGVCFQFRKPGKAPIPPGDMVAVPLIDAPLLQARLFLATRRGRLLPVCGRDVRRTARNREA